VDRRLLGDSGCAAAEGGLPKLYEAGFSTPADGGHTATPPPAAIIVTASAYANGGRPTFYAVAIVGAAGTFSARPTAPTQTPRRSSASGAHSAPANAAATAVRRGGRSLAAPLASPSLCLRGGDPDGRQRPRPVLLRTPNDYIPAAADVRDGAQQGLGVQLVAAAASDFDILSTEPPTGGVGGRDGRLVRGAPGGGRARPSAPSVSARGGGAVCGNIGSGSIACVTAAACGRRRRAAPQPPPRSLLRYPHRRHGLRQRRRRRPQRRRRQGPPAASS